MDLKKNLYTKVIFTIILLSISFQMRAQNDIRIFLDFARFRYDDTSAYLEIYYLLYDLDTDSSKSPVDVWLEFSLVDSKKDSLLASEKLKVVVDRVNENQINHSFIKGSLIKTVLPEGDYLIKMIRTDENSKIKMDSLNRVFSVGAFRSERVTLSDLELCCDIVTGSKNTTGIFYKNSMEIFPNPTHLFGPATPDVCYYIELYNVNSKDSEADLKIETAILDGAGEIRTQKSYNRSKKYESLVEHGKFDVSEFDNGLYTLLFKVSDINSGYAVVRQNSFYVMDSDKIKNYQSDMMSSFSGSEYFNMPETQVDERFTQIQYIASKKQVEIYNTLQNIEPKRVFMFKFWYERELEHQGVQDEYYARVKHANEEFGYANVKGWASDMGRVHVLYGEPDRRIRRPSMSDSKPFEIWDYFELEGGGKFLFVDETGFGDYKLKHSTVRGEVNDPRWSSFLFQYNTFE